MSSVLPEELYDEIVAYLWDDVPSLKTCSLTSRVMTAPSQRLLFTTVALRAERSLLLEEFVQSEGDLSGTAADFGRLLARHPHIASYVRSIHVIDINFQYNRNGGEDASGVLVNDLVKGDPSECGFRRWLPTDKSLPLFAPMLRNLKAVNISYDGGWHLLSTEVLGSLTDFMRRPSLVYVQVGDHIPRSILNLAPNVKHLVQANLARDFVDPGFLIQCPNQPSTAPVSLESLSIDRPCIFITLLSAPNPCVSITNLRKLVVYSDSIDAHIKIWYLLQFCLSTLEDFELHPSPHVALNIGQFKDSIDLGKMVSLKRFSIILMDQNGADYIRWLNRIIWSASANRQLEEICMMVLCSGSNDAWSRGAFDALLRGDFSSLKWLKIIFSLGYLTPYMCPVSAYPKDLKLRGHEDIERLRSQRGVAVDVMVCPNLDVIRFEGDVRWATHIWSAWKPVNTYLTR